MNIHFIQSSFQSRGQAERRETEALLLESTRSRDELKTRAQEAVRQWRAKCRRLQKELEEARARAQLHTDKASQVGWSRCFHSSFFGHSSQKQLILLMLTFSAEIKSKNLKTSLIPVNWSALSVKLHLCSFQNGHSANFTHQNWFPYLKQRFALLIWTQPGSNERC